MFLPFLLFVAGAFVACEEVEEEGKYDNWQQRNEAFADSIKAETGSNIVASMDDADNMELGELYAIEVRTAGTNQGNQYVYCKKLVANKDGKRPMYVGANSVVNTYFRATYITGDEALKCFDGYGALDREIPLPPTRKPSPFDSPISFAVTSSAYVVGATWPLQFMREGERWMLYIPWQSWGGSSDYTTREGNRVIQTIKGYSTVTYDLMLNSVE